MVTIVVVKGFESQHMGSDYSVIRSQLTDYFSHNINGPSSVTAYINDVFDKEIRNILTVINRYISVQTSFFSINETTAFFSQNFHAVIELTEYGLKFSSDRDQQGDKNTEKCEQTFSYLKPNADDIFKSPEFPKPYPERTECSYFFQAADEGRVKIDFDIFDLEDPSDTGCKFDYIDIYNIDEQGYKTLMSRFCGTKIPTVFVSLHSKMEIIFRSDLTKSGLGFLAHYEFLGESKQLPAFADTYTSMETYWHPFQPSTVGCGPGYLTGHSGVISSPGYNHNYPDGSSCTWIIKVKKENKVLVHLLDMDLKQGDTNKGEYALNLYLFLA
ncbi:hypothetical protein CHS0354_002506 [Potamilus streckersoni]|uniref:CUB domain-containing protein n=1 Tax=Potamilus streckersoni TaxID=2493646 RepID=A0AAE0W0T4_9BIVA|nr:hypothetical protein CHS0354_002506 [Potamilus streckersoni]